MADHLELAGFEGKPFEEVIADVNCLIKMVTIFIHILTHLWDLFASDGNWQEQESRSPHDSWTYYP